MERIFSHKTRAFGQQSPSQEANAVPKLTVDMKGLMLEEGMLGDEGRIAGKPVNRPYSAKWRKR